MNGGARRLDRNLLEKKRGGYLTQLSESPDVPIAPKTREEVFALIDAVKNRISGQPVMSVEEFRALVDREEKGFVRVLRKWKPDKKISPEKFRQLFNIYLVSSTKSFFSRRGKIRGILHPQRTLQGLAEMRSEHAMIKTQMLDVMKSHDIVSSEEYTVDTYIDIATLLFRGIYYLSMNYYMIDLFGLPYVLPRPRRLYDFAEAISPFFDMRESINNQKFFEGSVFYRELVAGVPYFVLFTYSMTAFQLKILEMIRSALDKEHQQQPEKWRVLYKEEIVDQAFQEVVFQWEQEHLTEMSSVKKTLSRTMVEMAVNLEVTNNWRTRKEVIDQILENIFLQWSEHNATEMPSSTRNRVRQKLESFEGPELIGVERTLERNDWTGVSEKLLTEAD